MTEVLQACTEDVLRISTGLYNGLPPDSPFPQVDKNSDGFNALCKVIAKHHAEKIFRLKLLHRHKTLSEGSILLGEQLPEGYWTAPTPIHSLNLGIVYPSVLSEIDGRLLPSEFRIGPLSTDIGDEFFKDFTQCLVRTGLGAALGLEIRQNQEPGQMIEFSCTAGSLLIDEEMVLHSSDRLSSLVETGWAVYTTDGGVVDKTGETRCHLINDKHEKITSSRLDTPLSFLEHLRDEGFISKSGKRHRDGGRVA